MYFPIQIVPRRNEVKCTSVYAAERDATGIAAGPMGNDPVLQRPQLLTPTLPQAVLQNSLHMPARDSVRTERADWQQVYSSQHIPHITPCSAVSATEACVCKTMYTCNMRDSFGATCLSDLDLATHSL